MELFPIEKIENNLPKNFRLKFVRADLEGPAEVVFNFPDIYFIERATKPGFLGLFKWWKKIAHINLYWNGREEIVYMLSKTENDFRAVVDILKKAKLSANVTIIRSK